MKDAPLAPDFWHSVVDKMKLMVGPKNLNRWINYSVDSSTLFGRQAEDKIGISWLELMNIKGELIMKVITDTL